MRRFGSAPRPGITYTERAGAYAVILHGDQLLVTEESGQQVEIQLPGGGIDPGESPIQALHREAAEETGWSLRVSHKLGVYQRYVFMPDYDLWARKICHVYLCRPGLLIGAPTEPNHRALFMDGWAAVDKLASPGDGHFAARVLRASQGPLRANRP